MINKGIVINLLCCNPSCNYSDKKLVIKKTLQVSESTGNCQFKIPKSCPKCASPLELLNFISGSVEIEPDLIRE